jgi:hypothetical protein
MFCKNQNKRDFDCLFKQPKTILYPDKKYTKLILFLAYFMPYFPFGTPFLAANFSSASWFGH